VKKLIYFLIVILIIGCVPPPEHDPKLDATTKYQTLVYSNDTTCNGAVFYSNKEAECDAKTCSIGPAFKMDSVALIIPVAMVVKKETWPAGCQTSVNEVHTAFRGGQEEGCSNGGDHYCLWDQDQIDQFKKLDKKQ
jgi:hypothetical protein